MIVLGSATLLRRAKPIFTTLLLYTKYKLIYHSKNVEYRRDIKFANDHTLIFESAPLVANRVDLLFDEKSRLNKGSFPCQEISGVVSLIVIKYFKGFMASRKYKYRTVNQNTLSRQNSKRREIEIGQCFHF